MFREAERATVRAEALGLTDDHGVYRVRALAHSLMGNHDKAVAALSRAIRLASSDPFWHSAYYRGRGTILLEMNKLDEAVADYTRALRGLGPGWEVRRF